jgi:hypothetical protein
VLLREPAHGRHHDHVVIAAHGRRLEYRGHLELRRSDFVVACFGRDPQAPEFTVQIHHEGEDSLADGAEVLILQLLALG